MSTIPPDPGAAAGPDATPIPDGVPLGPVEVTISSVLDVSSTALGTTIPVRLSNELAELLSKQLYRSPLKAIEELVVNAYDADAGVCRLYVPPSSEQGGKPIVVFDDGVGMDEAGLKNLWQIGRSTKRNKDNPTKRFERKQIGRFGIGKLATYTIANRLTYFTKAAPVNEKGEAMDGGDILTVSIAFSEFMKGDQGADLEVRRVTDWPQLAEHPPLRDAASAAGVDLSALTGMASWTLAYLEELNGEAEKIQIGTLRQVLATAMPIETSFGLYLNGDVVESSKGSIERVVEFYVGDLSDKRIEGLAKETGSEWRRVPIKAGAGGAIGEAKHGGEARVPGGEGAAVGADVEGTAGEERFMLVGERFPSGIRGRVFMTGDRTLKGKSDDLMRSHGFFVYARGRLINAEDALFGLDPLSYESFNRMYAVVHADDLDQDLTAPREGVEESERLTEIREVLRAIFNEARARRDEAMAEQGKKNSNQKEGTRTFVHPSLIEYPVADVLTLFQGEAGAEADGDWFYVDLPEGEERKELAEHLYTEDVNADSRTQYRYLFERFGESERVVRFDPMDRTFIINTAHEFVQAHMDDPRSSSVLRDLVTAEAFLEVYLRGAGVPAPIVGSILEKRDVLLRSLAKDRPYAPKRIAEELRDSAAKERELEFALVAAARALGFSATHVSGADGPDGVARYFSYPEGERRITLEAKSSKEVPSLGAIDFASLRTHVTDANVGAEGCLLVARAYPGSSKEDDARAAKNARENRISCWTIEQLARVVEAAETKRITAADILDIVLNAFTPDEVEARVDGLFKARQVDGPELYSAILDVLERLETSMQHSDLREIGTVHGRIVDAFPSLPREKLSSALEDLASVSGGGLVLLRDKSVIGLNTSLEELRRRTATLTKQAGSPRRPSTFVADGD